MRSLGNPRDDFADSISNPLKIEWCEFEFHLRCTTSENPNQDVKITFSSKFQVNLDLTLEIDAIRE